MELKESGENYLETILILSKQKEYVRAIDIANALSFSKPSVSRAIGILKDSELVSIDTLSHIHLTDKGLLKASEIYERHTFLTRYFISLGVSAKTAEKDACRIEHIISKETFEKLKLHYQNL